MSTYREIEFYLKISEDRDSFAKKLLNAFEKAGFTRTFATTGYVYYSKEEIYKEYYERIARSEKEFYSGQYYLNSEYEFHTGGKYILIEGKLYVIFGISVNANHFSRDESRIIPFVSAIKTLINLLDPLYCRESDEYYLEELRKYEDDIEKDFEFKRVLKNELIDFYYWINYLGSSLVERYGREKLLKGPFYKVEELATSGLLILLNPDCFWRDDGKHHQREEAIKYLGIATSWKEIAKAKLLEKISILKKDLCFRGRKGKRIRKKEQICF